MAEIKTLKSDRSGHMVRMGEDRRAFSVATITFGGKEPVGRPRPRLGANASSDVCGLGVVADRVRRRGLVTAFMG